MTVEPAWPSRFMSPTLTSGGMIVFSFWSPSLGPTSTILTGILLLAAVEYVPTESESVRRGETIAPLTVLVTALRDMLSYNNNFDKRESWPCQGTGWSCEHLARALALRTVRSILGSEQQPKTWRTVPADNEASTVKR